MLTSHGRLLIRLSDETPLHRDNFITLVKMHFYDSIRFHRVIPQFMIQGGDVATKRKTDTVGSRFYSRTIPPEFRSTLFHKKGVVAAARTGDAINPTKSSSATQFYIVQGKRFSDAGLDSVETFRLNGRKLPAAHRDVYKFLGGAPHLDQQYTIFGEVIQGVHVIDSIAAQPTTGSQRRDVPINHIYILKAKLVKRKR